MAIVNKNEISGLEKNIVLEVNPYNRGRVPDMPKIIIISKDLNHYNFNIHNIRSTISSAFKDCSIIISAPPDENVPWVTEDEKPDLIIIDAWQDDIDGNKTCALLRNNKNTNNVPVLLISSQKFLSEKPENHTGITADTVLARPLRNGDLSEHVKNMLRIKNAEDKLREKDLLIQEMHHRIKNNLSLLLSMLDIQSMNCNEKEKIDFIQSISNRIYSISKFHEKLFISPGLLQIDLSDYISELAESLCCDYRKDSSVDLIFNSGNILVAPQYAVPCGLIINEIITNSLKHAFNGDKSDSCVIDIKLEKKANQIIITISDNGMGIPEELDIENIDTFGMVLIKKLTEGQLKGKLDMKSNGGAQYDISFKVR